MDAVNGTYSAPAEESATTVLPSVPFDETPGQTRLAEIQAREITAWFGRHKVLDRVSLTMRAGGITALIGPSGCGKSTFLRILNRMHELVESCLTKGGLWNEVKDRLDAPGGGLSGGQQQAARVSTECAFFLAAQGTPGVIVEHGHTAAMFQNPQDQRTMDYVNGRFG